MLALLERWFARLESRKDSMLTGLDSWPQSDLEFCHRPGAWSALQVLDHLQRTEQSILDVMVARIPDSRPASLKDGLGAVFLIGLFLLPSRVTVPGTASEVLPSAAAGLEEISQRWDGTRTELAAVLDGFPFASLRCGVFKHPVSGWMTMPQTLRFLSAHLVHHGYQLRRLESALSARVNDMAALRR
jgi:hypothetical protein